MVARRLTGMDFEKHAGTIENVVDQIGVVPTVQALAEISFEKADHLRENWQDETSAKWWEKVGKIFDGTTAKLEKLL